MDRIYEKIGAQGTKIPMHTHGEFRIDGWNIVVTRGRKGGGGKPRIFVRSNGDLVPAGRVRQSLCQVVVHKARRRAARQRGPGGRFVWRRR